MTDLTPEERERIYEEEKARVETQKQSEDKKHFRVGCAALLVLFVGFIAWIALSGGSEPKGPDRLDAYVMSQQFVEKQLKTPSSAKFPVYDEKMVIPLGNNRFRVTSHVDAQNSFGAMIRTPYTCTIKNTEGDTWRLETINLSD